MNLPDPNLVDGPIQVHRADDEIFNVSEFGEFLVIEFRKKCTDSSCSDGRVWTGDKIIPDNLYRSFVDRQSELHRFWRFLGAA